MLESGQRSCEHTIRLVLSSLMVMFVRIVTLVLEMPRNDLLTLFILIVVTTRLPGIVTAQ